MHCTDWIKYKMQLLTGFYVCTVLHTTFIDSANLTWDHVNMEVKSLDFTHWLWCQTNIHILFHASETQTLSHISCVKRRVYVCLAPNSNQCEMRWLPPYRIFLIAERQPNGRAVPEKKTLRYCQRGGNIHVQTSWRVENRRNAMTICHINAVAKVLTIIS